MSIGYILFAGVFAGIGAGAFSYGLSGESSFVKFIGIIFFVCGSGLLISGLCKTSVFSLNGGMFIRGFRSVPLSRIAALQYLKKGPAV